VGQVVFLHTSANAAQGVLRGFQATIEGDGVGYAFNITHNLHTVAPLVQVYAEAIPDGGPPIYGAGRFFTDVQVTCSDGDTLELTFPAPVPSGQRYHVTIAGL